MSKLNIIIFFLILIVVAFVGWVYINSLSSQNQTINLGAESVNESSNISIDSFSFAELNPIVNGIISEDNHTVSLIVPSGSDVTALTPTIEVSDGASVSPASGTAEDFTNPVIYTVTAADGTHQDYDVSVSVAPNMPKSIVSFTLPNQVGQTAIDQNANTVIITVPYGTDITNLSPTIQTSANTTISPASGTAEDFTNPVIYTVTASDGSTQAYSVTVTVASN